MNLTRHGRNCLCVSKFLSSSQDRNLIIYYIKQSTYSSYDDLFNWYSSWWGYHLVCTYTCVICMNIRYIYIYICTQICMYTWFFPKQCLFHFICTAPQWQSNNYCRQRKFNFFSLQFVMGLAPDSKSKDCGTGIYPNYMFRCSPLS